MTDSGISQAFGARSAGEGPSARLVIGDRHVLFAEALHTALELHDYEVLGVHATRADAVRAAMMLQPDLVLLGRNFADGDGVDAIDVITRECPRAKVVILTADDSTDRMRNALEKGAAGYVHKTHGLSALVEAIRRVADGEVVVELPVVIPAPRRAADNDVTRLAGYLTARERECLGMLVEGLGTNDIAARLGVSITTVRTHIQAVLTKLGVHSRLQAASVAVRHGLVEQSSYDEFDSRMA